MSQLPFAADYDTLDLQLCDYVEALWEEGEPRSLAGDTLSGVSHLLRTRRQFPGAWALLTVWQRLELPARAAPMTPQVVLAVANVFLQAQRLDLVAVTVLMFHCALRVAEALNVHSSHLTFVAAGHGVVALPLTKMGQRRGAQEQVTIDDPVATFWVSLRAGQVPEGQLTNVSTAQYRTCLQKALAQLHLAEHGFRPYSLRRGGATWDFMQHQDLKRTMHRGHWRDLKTAQIYITEGAAIAAQQHFPAVTKTALQAQADAFLKATKAQPAAQDSRVVPSVVLLFRWIRMLILILPHCQYERWRFAKGVGPGRSRQPSSMW